MPTLTELLPADVASNVLDFSDAEFQAAPALDVQERELRLLDAAFEGIAIAAQPEVDTRAQSSLPIAIAARYDGVRDWDLPMPDNTLLVATDLCSGQVQVVPALVPPKVLASRHGARPDRAGPVRPPDEQLEGSGAQVGWTEVRSRIEIPWRHGRWSFGLVYFDWLSNLVTVELTGGAPSPGAMAPLVVSPLPAARRPGLPTYRSNSRTPPVPPVGIDFVVEADERGPVTRLLVVAAFETAARACSLVDSLTLDDGGQELSVAAVVPMTLLLVGANAVHPWRRDLAVPVYGPPATPDLTLQGCLALDAFADAAAPGPGVYACYLVLDGAIHGPQPIQLNR